MTKKITKEELNNILETHKIWLESNGKEGTSANLREANLRWTDLSKVDLSTANLN